MESIRTILDDHPMVKEVVELLTRYLGAHEIMVAARVELAEDLDSAQIAGMSAEIDQRLRNANPEITQVFIDPTAAEEHPLQSQRTPMTA
jgi:divalent metal cation (Fe/Co/Zn/Cd) transporter